MSDICIVSMRNLSESPNLEKYRRIISEDYDVVFWDHVGKGSKEECGAKNYFVHFGYQPIGSSYFVKIKQYLRFYVYINRFLRKANYNKLIITPNMTAWFILPWLKGKYKGKYILDIRDHNWNDHQPFKAMTDCAVNNSALTTIVCKPLAEYLPKRDYPISYNIQPIDPRIIEAYRSRKRGDGPIVMAFIGTIRFIPEQKKVIRAFGNDDRFIIRFIGRGSEQLKDFIEQGNYKNVELVGQFDKTDLGKFYQETDFALNLYGNERICLRVALSNKVMSSAMMGLPILCTPNTYSAEITKKYGFGLAVDLDDPNCKETVVNYFERINYDELYSNCDRFMKEINRAESEYEKVIREFVEM